MPLKQNQPQQESGKQASGFSVLRLDVMIERYADAHTLLAGLAIAMALLMQRARRPFGYVRVHATMLLVSVTTNQTKKVQKTTPRQLRVSSVQVLHRIQRCPLGVLLAHVSPMLQWHTSPSKDVCLGCGLPACLWRCVHEHSHARWRA